MRCPSRDNKYSQVESIQRMYEYTIMISPLDTNKSLYLPLE